MNERALPSIEEMTRESVLPYACDDGSVMLAASVSGGADYVDGMPAAVTLLRRDVHGDETVRRYVQCYPGDGVERIAAERQRQIAEEGWSPEHDDEHDDGDLALAAVCYATPTKLLSADLQDGWVRLSDPWPDDWDLCWDKRTKYGDSRNAPDDGVLPDPSTYSHHERVDLLVKAGALIAAEIDRVVRLRERQTESSE